MAGTQPPLPRRRATRRSASRNPFRRSRGLGLVLLAAWIVDSPTVLAQDAHYWSQQYGTRSELLGGTVVGGPQDLSTAFYNPGGLAFLEDQSFLLRVLAVDYETYELGAREEDGSEFASRRIGPSPVLIAGTFPRDWVSGTLAYAILTRQKADIQFNEWRSYGVDSGAPVGNLHLRARADETWGGVTWAKPFGSFGFGSSLFVAVRGQRGKDEVLKQPTPTDPAPSAVTAVNDYSYWHVRVLAKLGAYYQTDVASFGLSVTTPGLPLFGDGDAAFYRSLRPEGAPGSDDALVASDPAVTYRSPTSVAVGSSIDAGRAAFHVTAEWFDSVDRYQVLVDPQFPISGPGSSLTANLTQELSSVVNVGIGAEFTPEDDVTLFGSVITDFSAATDDTGTNHSFAAWDLYQVTGGTAFSVRRVDFTLGLSRAAGEGTVGRLGDSGEATVSSDVRYRRWKVFLGFEVRSAPDRDAGN